MLVGIAERGISEGRWKRGNGFLKINRMCKERLKRHRDRGSISHVHRKMSGKKIRIMPARAEKNGE